MLMSAILAAVWSAVWDAGQICNAGPYTEKRPNPQLGKNKGRRVAGSTPAHRCPRFSLSLRLGQP
jgi:hypothetical protein